MGLKLITTFEQCEECVLDKVRKGRVSKMAVPHSTVKGERMFMNISSPSTTSMGGKKHLLCMVEDSTDYALSYFSKEKSESKDVMMSLSKDLKSTYSVDKRYIHSVNVGENEGLCYSIQSGKHYAEQ